MKNNNLAISLIRDIYFFNIKDVEKDLENLWSTYQRVLRSTRTIKEIEGRGRICIF